MCPPAAGQEDGQHVFSEKENQLLALNKQNWHAGFQALQSANWYLFWTYLTQLRVNITLALTQRKLRIQSDPSLSDEKKRLDGGTVTDLDFLEYFDKFILTDPEILVTPHGSLSKGNVVEILGAETCMLYEQMSVRLEAKFSAMLEQKTIDLDVPEQHVNFQHALKCNAYLTILKSFLGDNLGSDQIQVGRKQNIERFLRSRSLDEEVPALLVTVNKTFELKLTEDQARILLDRINAIYKMNNVELTEDEYHHAEVWLVSISLYLTDNQIIRFCTEENPITLDLETLQINSFLSRLQREKRSVYYTAKRQAALRAHFGGHELKVNDHQKNNFLTTNGLPQGLLKHILEIKQFENEIDQRNATLLEQLDAFVRASPMIELDEIRFMSSSELNIIMDRLSEKQKKQWFGWQKTILENKKTRISNAISLINDQRLLNNKRLLVEQLNELSVDPALKKHTGVFSNIYVLFAPHPTKTSLAVRNVEQKMQTCEDQHARSCLADLSR